VLGGAGAGTGCPCLQTGTIHRLEHSVREYVGPPQCGPHEQRIAKLANKGNRVCLHLRIQDACLLLGTVHVVETGLGYNVERS
jgi:hypothetical protein